MIVDGHGHLFHPRWYPSRFTARLSRDVVARLSDDDGSATIRVMDAVGVAKRTILILDWGLELGEAPTPIRDIHDEILAICRRFKDRLIGFAGVDPRRPDAVDLLRWAVDDLGAQGLKLHPTGAWRLSDDATRRVVDVAAARRLPVVVHIGETMEGLTAEHARPDAMVALARAYPTVTFIAGHSGLRQWRQFGSGTVPDNLYFDIAAWQEIAAEDRTVFARELKAVVEAFPGRVFFGTDAPFYTYNVPMIEQRWIGLVRGCLPGAEIFESPLLLAGR